MLFRKIAAKIEAYLKSKHHERILIVSGARQVGKTYLIAHLGPQIFPNFGAINFLEDAAGPRHFANVRSIKEFMWCGRISPAKKCIRQKIPWSFWTKSKLILIF